MAFALGLAGVYMADRLPGTPYVELPTAVSTNVFPVFIDKSLIFTREQNCGLDPADPQARLDCTNQRLYGNRDLSLYAQYEVTNDTERECDWAAYRETRRLIWRHWKEKTRAHLTVKYCGKECRSAHYFVEPAGERSWEVSSVDTRAIWRYVDGEYTELTLVEDYGPYARPRWETVSRDDSHYYCTPTGTRYLEFENITGDTLSF